MLVFSGYIDLNSTYVELRTVKSGISTNMHDSVQLEPKLIGNMGVDF